MNPARFAPMARGAGVLTCELDARNLSRGGRVKPPLPETAPGLRVGRLFGGLK